MLTDRTVYRNANPVICARARACACACVCVCVCVCVIQREKSHAWTFFKYFLYVTPYSVLPARCGAQESQRALFFCL